MTVEILNGDCRQVISGLEENSIDAVVTDPPYGLAFMGKRWDYDVPDVGIWQEVLRVLKPGGHLLSFGGSRTYHRMAVAIEDAGFEIRDQIGWLYGSGFPKSHNMDGEWEGWGTALKPAQEPIVVARKALDGTVAQNLARWGVGALNIDGCRIEAEANRPWRQPSGQGVSLSGSVDGSLRNEIEDRSHLGRWPANVIHDGSDEVLDAFPNSNGSGPARTLKRSAGNRNGDWGMNAAEADEAALRDAGTGSAARFFYCAKASKKDRGEGNDHPTVKPTELMRYLCRLVTPTGGTVLDPFMGSGSTGRGAVLEGFDFIGIEQSPEYCELSRRRIAEVLA